MFVDTGAYRSYISSEFAALVKLTIISRENISYSSFKGSKASNNTLYKLFYLNLMALDGSIHPLKAAEVPLICKPFFRPKVPARIIESFFMLV